MPAAAEKLHASVTVDLARELAGNFVVANLGSGGDKDYDLPARFRRAMTVIEIDAGPKSRIGNEYYAKYSTASVISGVAGKATFRRHKYPYCSSLVPPREELIRLYGLEKYYEIVEMSGVECVTLPDLMQGWGLTTVDFLKTDLEGTDYPVIRSLDSSLDSVLAIQCELRFQPFYIGEPFFHEVAAYLYSRGFELVGMHPYYWKAKTRHQKQHRDGRVVLADCIFIRTRESVDRFPKGSVELARAKQILILGMVGLRSYAESLFESYRDSLPASWAKDLEDFGKPRPQSIRHSSMWRLAARIYHRAVKSPGYDFSHYVNNGKW